MCAAVPESEYASLPSQRTAVTVLGGLRVNEHTHVSLTQSIFSTSRERKHAILNR